MADDGVIKAGEDKINAHILAKEFKKDYLVRVEGARRKIPSFFSSPEVKRLFLRYFDSMQLNVYVISVIARIRLPDEMIEKLEKGLEEQIKRLTKEVDEEIVSAEKRFRQSGITSIAEYDTPPLTIEVRVISPLARRYLELINKIDQLMPILETLAIDEIITQKQLGANKALYKRSIKIVAVTARRFAIQVRKRMNEVSALRENEEAAKRADSQPANSSNQPDLQAAVSNEDGNGAFDKQKNSEVTSTDSLSKKERGKSKESSEGAEIVIAASAQ